VVARDEFSVLHWVVPATREHDHLEEAAMHDLHPSTRILAALVERVDDAQLGASTPCPDYTVGDLLDHIWRLAIAFTEAARKARGSNASRPPEGSRDHLPPDWRTRIPADVAALGAAWDDPRAWDGDTMIAGMEMPAAVVGGVALNEVVTHGWDLARAIGQPYEADHDSVVGCMEFVGPISEPGAEAGRAPAFGPVVAARRGASPFEHLIALTGRDPEWAPR
jgi:uncharacterized protein (TIGR03086 family)